MKRFYLINKIVGGVVLVLASIVFLSTMEPTVSLWDCGEFISAAYKLQVVHPPGAPFFLMVGRLFTMLASDPSNVAMMMNSMSAMASAFAVLFLFWIITGLAKEFFLDENNHSVPLHKIIVIMGAGMIGAASGAFADSFWFSAVEGEVYALSSFFTMLVFWCIMKWKNVADQPYADRWLLLIAFLMGLAIGVHLLNLLTIPAIVFVYYFERYETTRWGVIKTFIIACAILGFLQFGLITLLLPELMANFELFFVNGLGLPFYSGMLFFVIFLVALVGGGLYYTKIKNRPIINTALLCLAFILIGYSSYTMVVIRSNADPSIDMNDPENPFSLKSYLSREQYGSTPLLYGHYFTADVVDQKKGNKNYYQAEDKYKVKGHNVNQEYDPEHKTFFPRVWNNRRGKYVRFYRNWLDLEKGEKPDWLEDNLYFFFSYQLGWMYWRYFMWNFSGRQNDNQGHGNVKNGNWISGLPFIDAPRLGPQTDLPKSMRQNDARNEFYMLPFLLGIIGLLFHFNRDQEGATVVALLFFFTGIAIVIYLNQEPLQPRERDYSYAGSFLAYAIWIGMGVIAVYDFLVQKINKKGAAILACLLCALPPTLMGTQGWDDHDRSGRYAARDFAVNYLQSCPPNAILFTQGDNDTYPLWYAQEVEGIRTDVRIINLSLLSVDWYISQLKKKANDAPGVPFSMAEKKYRGRSRDYIPFHPYYNNEKLPQDKYYNAKKIVNIIKSNKSSTRVRSSGGRKIDYLPARKLKIPVDKKEILQKGVVSQENKDEIVSSIKWKIPKKHLIKSNLMLLDLVANYDWDRPICFAVSVSPGAFIGLKKYFQLEGLVYRFVPIKSKVSRGRVDNINVDAMYENVMQDFRWGNIADSGKHMGTNLRRMAMNLRIQVNQLGTALINQGKKDSAVKALDKSVEAIPHCNVPYNMVMLQTAQTYYRAGEPDKARPIARKVFNLYADDIDYYMRLRKNYPEFFKAYRKDFRRAARGVLPRVVKMARQHEDKELLEEVRPQFNALRKRLGGGGGSLQ